VACQERYAEGVLASTLRAIPQAGLLAFVLAASVLLAGATAGPDSQDHEVEKFTRSSRAIPSVPHALSNLAASRHKTLGGDAPAHAVLVTMPLPVEVCGWNFVRECDLRARSTIWSQRPPARAPPSL